MYFSKLRSMGRYEYMSERFWTINEVIEIFQVDETFLDELEEEEIICPSCRGKYKTKMFSSSDVEKLRLVKILIEEMGINLPGVEVILRMRQNMFEMRKQFDAILEGLAKHLKDTMKE